MDRNNYSNFISKVLYDMDFRSTLMMDIYKTQNYLNSEYLILFAKGNMQLYYLFHDFSLDKEFEFYLYLDMLTYLPFEKLGYDYLNNQLVKEESNITEYKYNKIMNILKKTEVTLDKELDDNIKYFLNNYYNDTVEINLIGLVIIILRLFHRYVTIMNFGGHLASMTIHKKIGSVLDKIVSDVNEQGLKEININDYLPEFDYSNELNDEMIKYLEYCLSTEY